MAVQPPGYYPFSASGWSVTSEPASGDLVLVFLGQLPYEWGTQQIQSMLRQAIGITPSRICLGQNTRGTAQISVQKKDWETLQAWNGRIQAHVDGYEIRDATGNFSRPLGNIGPRQPIPIEEIQAPPAYRAPPPPYPSPPAYRRPPAYREAVGACGLDLASMRAGVTKGSF